MSKIIKATMVHGITVTEENGTATITHKLNNISEDPPWQDVTEVIITMVLGMHLKGVNISSPTFSGGLRYSIENLMDEYT